MSTVISNVGAITEGSVRALFTQTGLNCLFYNCLVFGIFMIKLFVTATKRQIGICIVFSSRHRFPVQAI